MARATSRISCGDLDCDNNLKLPKQDLKTACKLERVWIDENGNCELRSHPDELKEKQSLECAP